MAGPWTIGHWIPLYEFEDMEPEPAVVEADYLRVVKFDHGTKTITVTATREEDAE